MERLEIILSIKDKEIMRVEGSSSRPDPGALPHSIEQPTYTYAGQNGKVRQGLVDVNEIMMEADKMGRNSGQDYNLCLYLTFKPTGEEETQ